MVPSSVKPPPPRNTGPSKSGDAAPLRPATSPLLLPTTPPPEHVGIISAPVQSPEELRDQYLRLRNVVREEPAVNGHRLLLASLCLRLGRKQEAKEVVKRLIELDPSSRPAALEILRGHLTEADLARVPVGSERTPLY